MNREIDFITIQISAKIYSGFQYKIPKDIINKMTEEEIIIETKTYMKNFFNNNNLYSLKDGIDALKLHFHDTIPIEDDITIIYLCDHCH
jgi:uncharacterized membrane protein YkgB